MGAAGAGSSAPVEPAACEAGAGAASVIKRPLAEVDVAAAGVFTCWAAALSGVFSVAEPVSVSAG